ncbi:hypothetical protein PCAR4_210038 [Paraburkholderia caribensis]|nr:hypothetical protein PCAR4_210038 [Paraburkholderia caribensis]
MWLCSVAHRAADMKDETSDAFLKAVNRQAHEYMLLKSSISTSSRQMDFNVVMVTGFRVRKIGKRSLPQLCYEST